MIFSLLIKNMEKKACVTLKQKWEENLFLCVSVLMANFK